MMSERFFCFCFFFCFAFVCVCVRMACKSKGAIDFHFGNRGACGRTTGPRGQLNIKPRGVLRFELDRGVPLQPQNPYPPLRVILVKKGTHF